MASKSFLHTITELCWLAFSPVVVKKQGAEQQFLYSRGCPNAILQHTKAPERKYVFSSSIFCWKILIACLLLPTQVFPFIFASFICYRAFEHNHSKVCVEWKWFPYSTLFLKYLFHLSVFCWVILLLINVMHWFTALRLLFWGHSLWVCQHIDCCPSWSWNHSKSAWIPEAVHLHYCCVLLGAIGITKE